MRPPNQALSVLYGETTQSNIINTVRWDHPIKHYRVLYGGATQPTIIGTVRWDHSVIYIASECSPGLHSGILPMWLAYPTRIPAEELAHLLLTDIQGEKSLHGDCKKIILPLIISSQNVFLIPISTFSSLYLHLYALYLLACINKQICKFYIYMCNNVQRFSSRLIINSLTAEVQSHRISMFYMS